MQVYENGRGTIEDNDIVSNGTAREVLPGIYMNSGTPVVRRNGLRGNGAEGIWVVGDGGTYEDNEGGQVVRK